MEIVRVEEMRRGGVEGCRYTDVFSFLASFESS